MRDQISLFLFFSTLTGSDASNRELPDAPIESALEAKRKEALGIFTETVTTAQWTPNGTIYVDKGLVQKYLIK